MWTFHYLIHHFVFFHFLEVFLTLFFCLFGLLCFKFLIVLFSPFLVSVLLISVLIHQFSLKFLTCVLLKCVQCIHFIQISWCNELKEVFHFSFLKVKKAVEIIWKSYRKGAALTSFWILWSSSRPSMKIHTYLLSSKRSEGSEGDGKPQNCNHLWGIMVKIKPGILRYN